MTDAKICSNPLQIVAVDYQMGAHWLFQNLNATFVPGMTAIVGENGCGKSTLLRILSGICLPTKGQILYKGIDIYQSQRNFKNQMGYVPHAPFLYPHLTVLENLRFVGNLRKCNTAYFNARLAIILDSCDLHAWQPILFNQLSDGLKKRVCIASMLLHDPKVLILDEPCSELDPIQRNTLWELLNSFRIQGKCIVFSSHHVKEIEPLCDQMFILSQKQLTRIEDKAALPLLFSQHTQAGAIKSEKETV